MDDKHSAGPWRIAGECTGSRHTNSNYVTIKADTGRTVAKVIPDSGLSIRRYGQSAAYDARLIKAAPNLLKAANELMVNARDMGECFDDDGNMHSDYQALEDAINEAERGF